MTDHSSILDSVYNQALEEVSVKNYNHTLPNDLGELVELLVSRSETSKGLTTVIITLLTHKIYDSSQDIRFHQAQLPNGFAGRTIDQAHITPFMKRVSFPSMSESGWLTRSLEQPHPYTLDYKGKITPNNVKMAFLQLVDYVECQGVSSEEVLLYFFKLLIKQRESLKIDLAKPHSLTISAIVDIMQQHFTYRYNCAGASRLPTLAIYSAYQCMSDQVSRFKDKVLCPLASHTSADIQSGRIGDVDVNREDGTAYEGVEIKHEIAITKQLVADAYEKFKIYNTDRYYLLTTANMESADWNEIEAEIQRIEQIHGCQVIVNGVYSSLKYYLRLLENPAEFIDKYVELLKVDKAIKFQHKSAWNDIISKRH